LVAAFYPQIHRAHEICFSPSFYSVIITNSLRKLWRFSVKNTFRCSDQNNSNLHHSRFTALTLLAIYGLIAALSFHSQDFDRLLMDLTNQCDNKCAPRNVIAFVFYRVITL